MSLNKDWKPAATGAFFLVELIYCTQLRNTGSNEDEP